MKLKLYNARTWPYGTQKQVRVLSCEPLVMAVADEKNEGYLLIGTTYNAREGDRGVITFTEGGPTGGFWKYEGVV